MGLREGETIGGLFKRPNWGHLCLYMFLWYRGLPRHTCRDVKSLFWACVIVGLWCAAVGVAMIGLSLLAYASRFLEVASRSQLVFHLRASYMISDNPVT